MKLLVLNRITRVFSIIYFMIKNSFQNWIKLLKWWQMLVTDVSISSVICLLRNFEMGHFEMTNFSFRTLKIGHLAKISTGNHVKPREETTWGNHQFLFPNEKMGHFDNSGFFSIFGHNGQQFASIFMTQWQPSQMF